MTTKRMTCAQVFKITDQKQEAKYDSGKPNWSLMPLKTIEMIVRVMDFGAAKYGESVHGRPCQMLRNDMLLP